MFIQDIRGWMTEEAIHERETVTELPSEMKQKRDQRDLKLQVHKIIIQEVELKLEMQLV